MTILLFLLICYFIPTIVASLRGHRNALAIFMANLFLGWTFVGWVCSLIWSCTSNTRRNKLDDREFYRSIQRSHSGIASRTIEGSALPDRMPEESDEDYSDRLRRVRGFQNRLVRS